MIKLSRMFREIVLRKEAIPKIKRGYLWVTKKWIETIPKDLEKGDVVRFVSDEGNFIAVGYVNPDSYIVGRIYAYSNRDFGSDLIESYMRKALEYRRKLPIASSAYRVFFSESDGLPGLIIDRYNDGLVFQVLTYGVERRKDLIIDAMEKVFSPAFIVERRDAPGRQLEGLEVGDPIIHKGILEDGLIVIEENGLRFYVDVLKGHKTGHYLDQRENRKIAAEFAKGRKVLDVFCNTGGFGVYCAKNGAYSVTSIDISDRVLDIARKNAILNGVEDRMDFIKGNAFDELRRLYKRGDRYDMVILDPPSFVKSSKVVDSAVRGYFDINLFAIKLLKRGGILVTASCSHHFTLDLFMDVLEKALYQADRRGRIIDVRFQAMDHPILPSMPETLYLKLVIMEVY